MIHKIKMPRVDANVQEATLGAWCVDIGTSVNAGDPLVEVITDKANFEYESEVSGILRMQVAEEKSTVPVGYVIALVSDSADEALPDVEDENEAVMESYRQALITGDFAALDSPIPAAVETQPAPARPASRVRAVPAARKLAAEKGVDLEDVAAQLDGVVRVEDVEAYIESKGADR